MRFSFALILLLAALSAAAGIAYEVVWTHALGLAVGSGTVALSLVLAVFLGGMAFGGHWASRRSPARPLRACGLIGILLALFGAAMPALLRWMQQLVAGLADFGLDGVWARGLLALIFLLPPTFLMGATFPWWIEGLKPRLNLSRARVSALFCAVQVLGGAAGAGLAGFLVVPSRGFATASHIAAGLDALVGLALLFVPWPAEEAEKVEDRPPFQPRFAAAFFLAGIASLGYQTVWTRALVFHLDGLHYAFAAVLTAVLLGLAAGGGLALLLAGRGRRPENWLAGVQLAVALAGLATCLGAPLLGEPTRRLALEGGDFRLGVFLLAVAALFVPASLIGTTLPLATWVSLDRGGRLGEAVGRAYAQTTWGNALGALLVPLLLVPVLGLGPAWAALSLLNVAAALLLCRGRSARVLCAVVGIAALFPMIDALRDPRPLILDSHVFAGRRGRERSLLFAADGRSASVAVVEDHRLGLRSLYTDSFSAAATGRHNHYMRLLGHLPALLARDPENALVICFGTGTTAGSVRLHEEVRRLRLVDIEARVFETAPWFEDANGGVLKKPGVETVVRDGRLDLLLSPEPWQLVTLEPLLPHTQGAAHFYTREFYEVVRDRLAEGGSFCHWIPVHALPVENYRQLVATFLSVFPEGSLFFFDQSSLLFARKGGGAPDHGSLVARCRQPKIREGLRGALVGGADDLLAARIAGGEEFAKALSDVPVMSDDRPEVMFLRERQEVHGFGNLLRTLELLRRWGRLPSEPDDLVSGLDEEARTRIRRLRQARLALLESRFLEAAELSGLPLDRRESPWGSDPILALQRQVLAAFPGHPEARSLAARREGRMAVARARAHLRDGNPLKAVVAATVPDLEGPELLATSLLRARGLALLGDPEQALVELEGVLEAQPENLAALVLRSLLLARLQRGAEARADEEKARALDAEESLRLRAVYRAAEERTAPTAPKLAALRKGFLELLDPTRAPVPQRLDRALRSLPEDPELRRLIAGPLLSPLDDSAGDSRKLRSALSVLCALPEPALLPLLIEGEREAETPELAAAYRLAIAALPPPDAETIRADLASPDVALRRMLAWAFAERGTLEVARDYLSGLLDDDEDVRFSIDRGLRRLAGFSVGYDYQAAEDERRRAAQAWADRL